MEIFVYLGIGLFIAFAIKTVLDKWRAFDPQFAASTGGASAPPSGGAGSGAGTPPTPAPPPAPHQAPVARVDQMDPWLVQNLLWIIFATLIVIGLVVGFVVGLKEPWFIGVLAGSLPVLLSLMLLIAGLEQIPADPPTKAIVLLFGQPTDCVKDAGWRLFFPWFPLFYDKVSIKTELINKDLSFPDVACNMSGRGPLEQEARSFKAGGFVLVDVNPTFYPNPKELKAYVKAGKEDGVVSILRDMCGQYLRHLGRNNTWENLATSQAETTLLLIKKLTGEEPRAGESYDNFTARFSKDGFADIHGLGIVLKKINVSRVVPQGDLKKDAEGAAREKQQLARDKADMKANAELLKILKGMCPGVKDEELLKFIQTDRRRAQRLIIDASGDAAAMLGLLAASGMRVGQAIQQGQSKKK